MPSEKLQVILELVTGQYKREAREAATATGRIGDAAVGAGGGVGRLQSGLGLLKGAVAAIGVTRLVGEFKEMGQAAAEDAEAQEILAGALRTNLGATDDMIASNERWIDSMQVATRTADNELRQSITDLTVAGRDLESSQKDVGIAIDIAASKGIELGSVIKGMVRALATGSTAGLGRLGIETKNAAGEMLTYDQVLQNAAKTMGGTAARAAGTLAGALERSKIIMAEAREEAGKNIVGPWAVLSSIWNEFGVALLGGDKQLAALNTAFTQLVATGIDPFVNGVASALTIIETMNDADLTTGTLETLFTMLGLTTDQVLQLRGALIGNEEWLGLNADTAAELATRLDEYLGVADPAVLATRRFKTAQQEAAGATRDHSTALQAQRDLLREMTDPIFALLAADDRYEEAQTRLNELTIDGGTNTREYQDALGDLLRAQLDMNQAQADANTTGLEGLDLLEQIAVQAGINMEAFNLWRDSVLGLASAIAGLPPTVGGRPTITSGTSGNRAFAHGGIVPGPRGSPQIILAHGGETILPTHRTEMFIPQQTTGSNGWTRPNGPVINVNHPNTANLAQDLQLATILASVTTMVERQ